jgi:hypothetical protein
MNNTWQQGLLPIIHLLSKYREAPVAKNHTLRDKSFLVVLTGAWLASALDTGLICLVLWSAVA